MNWLLLKNSLLVSGLATLLAVAFGAMAALWGRGLPRTGEKLLIALAILALALPPFLVTNSWLHFLGEAGVWRSWIPFNIFSTGGTTWILAMLTWPIAFFALLAAWRQVEPSLLESDPALRGWRLIGYLLLPLARAAVAQGAVITFVLALNNFAVPAILQVKVFPAETWVRFSTNFDSMAALCMSWPLIVVPLIILLWLGRKTVGWPRIEGAASAKIFRRQLGSLWFCLAGFTTAALIALSVGAPLLQLVSVKRTWTELAGALAAGQGAIWNSTCFAVTAATLCLALCLVAVIFGRASPGRYETLLRPQQSFGGGAIVGPSWRSIGAALLWLPFLTPGVLLGILLIAIFNRPVLAAFYQSAGIVILALIIRYFAPGWTIVKHAAESTDPDLKDAALICGASRWQMFWHVLWPQIAPQVSAAWYVLFLLCLWDVESIVLIVPPGGETMALRIFNLLHYGHNAQVNALCLTLLLMALGPLVIYGGWGLFRTGSRMLKEPRYA